MCAITQTEGPIILHIRAFFKNSTVGVGGGGTYKRDHTILSVEMITDDCW